MKSCAYFGHRAYHYAPMRETIKEILTHLIVHDGVTEFYSGYRGDFDVICSELVHDLKAEYPEIKLWMVLAYHPQEGFRLPPLFDGSLYLLERNVPRRYAILETNQCLVDRVDVILSGAVHDFGGAVKAIAYAEKRHKKIVYLKTE